MEVKSNYRRALSYAFKCNPALYRDFVHQAYIQNYQKDGSNLFEKDIYHILRYVRNVWFTYIRDSRFQYKGERYQRQFFDVDPEVAGSFTPTTHLTPDRLLISKEFVEEFWKQINNYNSGQNSSIEVENLRTFVLLVEDGFKQKEIAELMGESVQRINYWSKKVKEIVKMIHNPLRTSTVQVARKISRKTYEEKYSQEYKYDADAGCDYNEFYMLVHNGTDFMLIKEKEE
jgi:DNA-directed RNA polymerase specialized sigma24 family protein